MSTKNLKNVVIFTNLEDSVKEQILRLKNNEWLKGANIHLVHIFHVATNNFEFGLYTFPSEEQKPAIKDSVVTFLNNLKKEVFTEQANYSSINTHCLFASAPKDMACDFLRENKAQLAIAASRNIHGMKGLFTSSFTEHLNKFSPCDVLVLRPLN